MSFPSQLMSDTRSPADGYLFWPEWMREVFLDRWGWTINEVFRAAFWCYITLVIVLLAWFFWQRKRWRMRSQLWGGLVVVVAVLIIPNFDRIWIHHEFVGACRDLAGIHIQKVVKAEGYLYLNTSIALRPVQTPNYPEWSESKYTSFPAAYKLGDGPGRFRFIEFPYHKGDYYPGYRGVMVDEAHRNIVHTEVMAGKLMETVLDKPMARYAYMRSPLRGRSVGYGVGYSEYRIVDLQTQGVVAREIGVGASGGWVLKRTIGLLGETNSSCSRDYRGDLPADSALSIQNAMNERFHSQDVNLGDVRANFRNLVLLHHPRDLFELALSKGY